MPDTLPARRTAVSAPVPAAAPAENVPGALAETVRTFCFVMFRHRRKAAAFFLAVVLTALVTLLFMGRSYTSEARLFLRRGRESVAIDPTATTGGPLYPVNRDWETEVNSELEILKSRELAETVVRSVGPARILGRKARPGSGPEAAQAVFGDALRALRRELEIDVHKKSNILAIRYTARDAGLAREVVSGLIDAFLAKHMAVHQAPGTYDFFLAQTEAVRRELEEAEIALRNFKNVFGIASLDEQQSLALGRVRLLRDRLEETEASWSAAKARAAAIAAMLAGGEPGRRTGPLIAGETRRDLQAGQLDAQAALASLQAQRAELKQQLAAAERELQNLNDSEVRIRDLERERNLLTAKYEKYTDSLEQARINRALEQQKISNISVVQPAFLPLQSNPRGRLLKMILAVLLGGAGAVGIAFLGESLDHSLKRPDDVEAYLGLTMLSAVPWIEGGRLHPVPAGAAVMDGAPAESWRTPPHGVEAFEILGDRILRDLTPALVPPVILGVTSCREGEGVTGTAANLALTLARLRREAQVLYVDANPAVPPGARAFGLRGAGAVEIAIDDRGRTVAAERRLQDAAEAPADGAPSVPALYDRWMPLIRKRDYGFVVFDLPPLREERSAMHLGGSMDGVIVTVEAERVRREIVQRGVALLRETKTHIVGVCLNKRRFHVPEWVYRRL
ncbi:MAG: hypothetical protein JW951_09455 [Lentisphaerae bacterium]|nr:hypothetical protein [Lentisphaerota bacterium]